jgi:hypothetical protein
VTTFEQLDELSSQELHDRAVARARRHLDLKFLWSLVEETPTADAADGDPQRSEEEVAHWSRQFLDAFSKDPEAIEARRPIYIDYLLRHSE